MEGLAWDSALWKGTSQLQEGKCVCMIILNVEEIPGNVSSNIYLINMKSVDMHALIIVNLISLLVWFGFID